MNKIRIICERMYRIMQKKLYRSTTQKVFSGVCGGIAEYFDIDVTLVRLVWVVLTLPGFIHGILLYIIASIVIPENPRVDYSNEQYSFENEDNLGRESYAGDKDIKSSDSRNKVLLVIGLILIAVGSFSILKDLFPPIWNTLKEVIFPVAIIAIGAAIVYSATKNK